MRHHCSRSQASHNRGGQIRSAAAASGNFRRGRAQALRGRRGPGRGCPAAALSAATSAPGGPQATRPSPRTRLPPPSPGVSVARSDACVLSRRPFSGQQYFSVPALTTCDKAAEGSTTPEPLRWIPPGSRASPSPPDDWLFRPRPGEEPAAEPEAPSAAKAASRDGACALRAPEAI
ncbi:PREDICTED: translation initiation factor IF-2-like [Chinchilla lanigera]|uniref:translation initiation factor IF-2-like n=1 Tax=Chinchilla lanigera TaxID=34839 RepID=UPI0006975B78|nr:PREDICTED: translation initiation factor IF-2-like [Chinchilla lanigera]